MDHLARKRCRLIVKAAGLAAVLGAYMVFISRRARKQTSMITIGRRIDMDIARESNLRYIYHSTDTNCLNQLRMKRAPFFRLCTLLRERELLLDSIHTSIEKQVAMFLLVVGHNTRFRALQPIFRRSIDATTPSPSGSNRKRKRASILSEEDTIQCNNMSDALRDVAGAINNTCHTETHPDLCKAVMDLTEFEMDQRLVVLDYLTEHKGKGFNFVKMEVDVRQASFRRIIAKNPSLV